MTDPTREDYERAAEKIGELCPFDGKHTCPYCRAAVLLTAAAERMTWRPIEAWTGEWNNWIAPFHRCPRCNTSLNWNQSEDALERPRIDATCCGTHFVAMLQWFPPAPKKEGAE